MATIRHELSGDIRVIAIDAVHLVDGAMIEQCYREIIELLDKTEESQALLHFGRVAFMSSSALGMLVRINKKCKEYSIALKLCGISPDIRQVFKITGMDKIFDIHDEASQAVEAFRKSGLGLSRKRRPSSYDIS
jgi:anti-anti-sigma factor